MTIRRGSWQPATINKTATIKTGRHGARPAVVKDGVSNSEGFLAQRKTAELDPTAIKGISEQRREELIRATSMNGANATNQSPLPVVVNSNSFKRSQELKDKYIEMQKTASIMTSGGPAGSGGTVHQAPEVYSPLFQIANLQLPRDRITMNAWNRNFYDTHPLVHNCINLHATYPINKINIKCKDLKIEQFFNEMAQDIDLMGILQSISLEFWRAGECFPYAELDETRGTWKSIVIQNPDFIHVKQSVLGGQPVISMRPDAALQRLVMSNNPADLQLRNQIDEQILYHIRKGNDIPLDNFHVSHLKMLSAPYDVHGTSIIVNIYKDLMLYDKLRESKFAQADNLVNPITLVKIGGAAEGEYHPDSQALEQWRQIMECHDEETEVLTDQGFKKFDDVVNYQRDNDGKYITNIKENIKIACFNQENESLEYYVPSRATLYDYSGDMYHYKNEKIDLKVTPNHDLFVSSREYEYNGHRSLRKTVWSDWKKVKAQDLKLNDYSRFRSKTSWEGSSVDEVDVLGKKIPIELYLEFLGYVLSEGCLYNKSYSINVSQTLKKFKNEMKTCIDSFSGVFGVHNCERIRPQLGNRSECWSGTISNKRIFNYIKSELCDENGKAKAPNKKIPRWILGLNKKLLTILIDAMVKGDGSILPRKNGIMARSYYTTSKQMADDVFEAVYKCGFVPTMFVKNDKRENRLPVYTISWSSTKIGEFPLVCKEFRNSTTKQKTKLLNIEKYDGKVWCFTVPTGLFITRRNGKITIQGNSAQYDRDFKIITHAGVTVERVGASGAIIDIAGDVNQIIDNILYGLLVPKAIITQDGAGFNSASIGLEVLKQRYESFRNMMAQWLTKKIFAPISEIQEFYSYEGGVKKLIVPEIEWNKMILFDMDNYINILNTLVGAKAVSKATLFKSLGLSAEEERRQIKEEMIHETILAKETEIMQTLSLGALRALKPDEDIIEPTEAPLPGTPGAMSEGAGIPGAGGLPGMAGPDLGLGGGLGGPMGGMPPAPPSPMSPPIGGPGGGDLGMGGGAPVGPGGAPPAPIGP